MMTNAFTDKCTLDLSNKSEPTTAYREPAIRKFSLTLQPGQSVYDIRHYLGTEDIIVQTRIAGRIREGGISILNPNCLRLTFGGTLNEPLDVVIIG